METQQCEENTVITYSENRIVFAGKWQVVMISGEAIVPAGLPSPVKGGSCAGKKITTTTLYHGLPAGGPRAEKKA